MSDSVLVLVILVALDVLLWVLAVLMPLGQSGRFRLYATASLLLLVLGGTVLGWGPALAIGAIAIWIASIVVANSPTGATM